MRTVDLFECQNCEAIWDEKDLKPVKDLEERVSPGEPVPYGECPTCGAVCHPYEDEYVTGCPFTTGTKKLSQCPDTVHLTFFEAHCKLPLTRDGWSLADGHSDTYNERFACATHGAVPSDWVFGNMTRKAADASMKVYYRKKKKKR